MGQFNSTVRGCALAIFGVSILTIGFVIAGTDSADAAKAKAKPGAPAAPASEAQQQQQGAALTRQSYESGIKSYSAGKFQPAVDELSGALRGGGLGSAEMAKALYVRGLAYKKLSKPGRAISDLTSALWLKNGLGEADQKNAIAERGEAYRLAGLGDGNSGNDSVSVADPNPAPAGAKAAAPAIVAAAATPAKPAKPAPAAKQAAVVPAGGPAQAPVEVTRQSPDSESARDAANARKLASLPVETGGLQSAAVGSLIGDQARAPAATVAPAVIALATPAAIPAVPAQAPVLAAAPIETAPPSNTSAIATTDGAMKSVTGFFSNMFGGGSKANAPEPAVAPVTTASTSPPATTSSWSNATSVANGAPKAKAATAATAAATGQQAVAAAPAPAMTPGGKFKIHIAAVRSKAEAEALAQKLSSQNGATLKSRSPVVDEAVIGSMGTFYRVRVGSYATAEEPRGVCNTLRASGFDCLVVTN